MFSLEESITNAKTVHKYIIAWVKAQLGKIILVCGCPSNAVACGSESSSVDDYNTFLYCPLT